MTLSSVSMQTEVLLLLPMQVSDAYIPELIDSGISKKPYASPISIIVTIM